MSSKSPPKKLTAAKAFGIRFVPTEFHSVDFLEGASIKLRFPDMNRPEFLERSLAHPEDSDIISRIYQGQNPVKIIVEASKDDFAAICKRFADLHIEGWTIPNGPKFTVDRAVEMFTADAEGKALFNRILVEFITVSSERLKKFVDDIKKNQTKKSKKKAR